MLQRVNLSSEATARDVTTSNSPTDCANLGIFGPTADHRHIEPQLIDHLAQELAATQQRLDQRDMHIGARQSHGDSREAGATADIADALIGSQELSESGAIENVSIPEPVHFPRTDQTPLDTGTGQNRRVPLRRSPDDLRRPPPRRPVPRGPVHVSRETSSALPTAPSPQTNYTFVTKTQPSRTTTRRDGSTPSLSLRTPSTAATAS